MDTKNNKTLTLQNIPKDKSYEDYVAALLNAGGYYLERNVLLRDKTDVLELDIVTNSFNESYVDKTILEVKSGGWGFPEIFKVKGWMVYLNLPKASFVVQKENGAMAKYQEVAEELSVNLVSTPEHEGKLDETELCKIYEIKKHKHNEDIVASLRFAFSLERKMVDIIQHTAKSVTDKEGYDALKEYLFEINCNSFFVPDTKARVTRIFGAYTSYKNITARIDHERAGEKFAEISDDVAITDDTFISLFYSCTASQILYCSLYVEWLQRMSMLKCCVEEMQRPKQHRLFDFSVLPAKLEKRMEELKEHAHYYLYPYFWQIFIYLFGGFILNDKKDEEYKLLSELSGIPETEIDNALSALDILFPFGHDKNWLLELENSHITVLQLFPIPLCGIGANFRREIYSDTADYSGLRTILSGVHTCNDLQKWNNLGYDFLEKAVGVVPITASSDSK